MDRCRKIAPITSLQPPYSAISPEIEDDILPYCQKHGIGVIVYSPMKSGLLTGTMTRERVENFPQDDFRRRALSFQEPALSRNLDLAELMKQIGARHGRSAGEVAIAWTLRHPAVTAAIVGFRSSGTGGRRHRRHGFPAHARKRSKKLRSSKAAGGADAIVKPRAVPRRQSLRIPFDFFHQPLHVYAVERRLAVQSL